MTDHIADFFLSMYDHIQLDDVDPNLFHFFKFGMGLGTLIAIVLELFPGKPLGIKYGEITDEMMEEVGRSMEPKKETNDADLQRHSSSGDNNTTQQGRSGEWAGDKIPKEQLEKLQKKFKLTDNQMKELMNKSREQYQGQTTREDATEFYRQVNFMIYVIIIAFLIYVVNRDYKNYVSFWFARFFPQEARTLGLFVPEPKTTM